MAANPDAGSEQQLLYSACSSHANLSHIQPPLNKLRNWCPSQRGGARTSVGPDLQAQPLCWYPYLVSISPGIQEPKSTDACILPAHCHPMLTQTHPIESLLRRPTATIRKKVAVKSKHILASTCNLHVLADLADLAATTTPEQQSQAAPAPSVPSPMDCEGPSPTTTPSLVTSPQPHRLPVAPLPLRPFPERTATLPLPSIPETSCLSGLSEDASPATSARCSPRSAFVPVSPPHGDGDSQARKRQEGSPDSPRSHTTTTSDALAAVNAQLAAVFDSMGPSLVTAGQRIRAVASSGPLSAVQWLAVPATMRTLCDMVTRALGRSMAQQLLGSGSCPDPMLPPLPGRSARQVLARVGAAVAHVGAAVATEPDKLRHLAWLLEPQFLSMYYALKSNGPSAAAYLPFCTKLTPCFERAKAYGLLPATPQQQQRQQQQPQQ